MPTIQIQHQEFEPPEELRDNIRCFWYDTRDFGATASSYEVQPDGYAEIIFHFGSDFSVVTAKGLQSLPSPFMMGLLNQPAVFHAKNRLQIIGIRCFPWTVFDLLGLPSGKDGVRIFEHPIAQLQPALNQCIQSGKIEEALALVKQYFMDARYGVGMDSMLSKAGFAMQAANGNMPVSQVATAAHATARTLERKFKQSSGHSVKDVSGLIRFEQVRNRLWIDPNINLAGLAYELGYTDQPHLSKEFKRYSGTTPAAFAREAKKGQQITNSDYITFIKSAT